VVSLKGPGKRKTRRNFVVYDDRSDTPRLHLEFRYSGTEMCSRRGMSHAHDFAALDLYDVLLKDVRLSALDMRRVDKLVEQEAHETARHHRARRGRQPRCHTTTAGVRNRIERIILCSVFDDEELPDWTQGLFNATVQDVLDEIALVRRDRYAVIHLPAALLLY
jgi:hypothetical protein